MFYKSVKSFALLTLVLLMTLTVSTVPAGAEQPDEIITLEQLELTYALGNFTSVNGGWSSPEGIFQGSGTAVQSHTNAGWPGNGWQFLNAQVITTLYDNVGTVTIKDQVTGITWNGFDFTADGRWVIIDATGAYEGLHGVGTSDLTSTFHPVCPDPIVEGVCLISKTTLNGLGHFDP